MFNTKSVSLLYLVILLIYKLIQIKLQTLDSLMK